MLSSARRELLRSIRECLCDAEMAMRRNEEARRQGAVPIDLMPLRILQAELEQLERMLLERQESQN